MLTRTMTDGERVSKECVLSARFDDDDDDDDDHVINWFALSV